MASANFTSLLRSSTWLLGRTDVEQSQGHARHVELAAIPPMLRAADTSFVAEWRSGHVPLAGHSVFIDAGSPFAVAQAPDAWWSALFGFSWLRHVPASSDDATVARVQEAVHSWVVGGARHHHAAQREAILPRRVLSWLAHADVLLQTSDAKFYDLILVKLLADVRSLERPLRGPVVAGDRLLALIALAQAGLCIAHNEPMRMRAEAALAEFQRSTAFAALGRQPDQLAEMIIDIEALRLLYGMRGVAVPSQIDAIKRDTTAALAALMLGNGRPARLATPRDDADAWLTLASVRRHAELAPASACYNERAGFARLVSGDTQIVADVGAPLDCAQALAFEMSCGNAALLTSDGLRADRESSGTIIFAQGATASTQALPARSLPGLESAHNVAVELADLAVQSVDATHAGLAVRGFTHRRRLALRDGGRLLEGVDELRPLVGRDTAAKATFAVRLVLHPSVEVALSAATDQLDLTLANGHRWTFAAAGRVVSVEGAIFRDGLRATPTLQILVPVDTASSRTVTWQLTRTDAQG